MQMADVRFQGIQWPHTCCDKYMGRVVYRQNPSYPDVGNLMITDWMHVRDGMYHIFDWSIRIMLAQSNGSWTVSFQNICCFNDIRTPYNVCGIIHVLAMCFAQGILARPRHLVWHNHHHQSEFSQALHAWIKAAWARSIGLKHVCNRFVMQARVACRRKHSVAKKIQRAWRKAISDPSYAMCRKRLLQEFEEMDEL